jgi:signal transduction histidine kinase
VTIRLRTAITFAATFALAGAVVLAIGAVTYQNAVYLTPDEQAERWLQRLGVTPEEVADYIEDNPEAAAEWAKQGTTDARLTAAFEDVQREAQGELIDRFQRWSIVALVVMSLAAAVAGWLIAGRAVAPLRTVTARARSASGADLSGRVGSTGPPEIRELSTTFDEMLERLERAFVAQRRFSAQVSHEVRTPLAIITSEAELLRADASAAQLVSLDQIQAATERAERIVEALLLLARSGSGDVAATDLRLDRLTGDVLGEMVAGQPWHRVRVDLDLEPAPVRGDPGMLERLVVNLLSNSARHNRPDGWVEVRTGVADGWATLSVANSTAGPVGPVGPTGGSNGDGTSKGNGGAPGPTGVGLTVVDSVVAAHGGELTWSSTGPDAVTATVRLPTTV